jgi:hypothetical protein
MKVDTFRLGGVGTLLLRLLLLLLLQEGGVEVSPAAGRVHYRAAAPKETSGQDPTRVLLNILITVHKSRCHTAGTVMCHDESHGSYAALRLPRALHSTCHGVIPLPAVCGMMHCICHISHTDHSDCHVYYQISSNKLHQSQQRSLITALFASGCATICNLNGRSFVLVSLKGSPFPIESEGTPPDFCLSFYCVGDKPDAMQHLSPFLTTTQHRALRFQAHAW